MNRRKIEIIFIGFLLVVSIVLFKTTIIYKSQLLEHPFAYPLFGIIAIGFIFFNYRVLHLKLIKNIIYSILTIISTFYLSFIINGLIIFLMIKVDNERTPLGWTFNYTWFSLVIFGLLLVISTELVGIRISKKYKQ